MIELKRECFQKKGGIKLATIQDIAVLAGVSRTTVSRVLNYDESLSVSDKTKKKIFEAAEELEYTKHKKSKIVEKGKIVVVQWLTEKQELEDIYYLALRMSAEKKIIEEDYEIVRMFKNNVNGFPDELIGIISIGECSDENKEFLKELSSNIVFVGVDMVSDEYDSVIIDFEQAVSSVVDYFYSKGNKRIGFIGGKNNIEIQQISYREKDTRLLAFEKYTKLKGVYNPSYVFEGRFDAESGYTLMTDAIVNLKEELPTSFFLANDAIAVGALRALAENNISVPERVELIGFNDSTITNYVFPTLSSVKVYTDIMGETAINLLIEKNITNRKIAKKNVVATSISFKGSTK